MKIFGNCLIKNEADVIEEVLMKATRWCDRIFIFDNGSTDGTWEIVNRLARTVPNIVPFKSAAVPYRDSLRLETFAQFRHESGPGDWWCKLDSDEIYVDDPCEFLTAVPPAHHVVWAVSFQFYFTDLDAARWSESPRSYPPDAPAEEALRYYRCEYSEARFYRYRPRLKWDYGFAPRHLGLVHPRRIRLKHYQYRSPAQIDLRLAVRQRAMAEGCGTFQGYCDEKSWREKVVPAASCHSADEPSPFLIEPEKIPHHLEPAWQRMVKRFAHGSGVWP
jgi:glycosyltransferase involved in cell wall biosynthesis